MKTLTVDEIRNMLAYLPGECKVYIALSRERVVGIDIENIKPPAGMGWCNCDDDETCYICGDDEPDQEVFLRVL